MIDLHNAKMQYN